MYLDEDEGSSSTSTSPNFSPLDSNVNFSTSPQLYNGNYVLEDTAMSPHDSPQASLPSPTTHISPSYPYSQPLPQPAPRARSPHLKPQYPSGPYSLTASSSSHSTVSSRPYNKATAICLMADGMTPFSIKLDALEQASPSALALKIKLAITSVDDIRSPSTIHGFAGSLCLAQVWNNTGKCTTRVYTNNVCVSEEVGALDISSVEVGTVVARFPESMLGRCRWLDACKSTIFISMFFALTMIC